MTQTAWLVNYHWLIALTVAVGVISWVVLLLQALFHDQRIALVGVFGSLLFSFTFLFPQFIPLAIKYSAATLCAVFVLWFGLKHWQKPYVYLPALGVVMSSVSAWWLYHNFPAGG